LALRTRVSLSMLVSPLRHLHDTNNDTNKMCAYQQISAHGREPTNARNA
jgi:hypothetical protein